VSTALSVRRVLRFSDVTPPKRVDQERSSRRSPLFGQVKWYIHAELRVLKAED
jgi:hypothetical protein